MEKKTFGQMIAERRKAVGMTQAELAERMGITDKAVSKWERDLSYPDISSVPHLAEVIGVSIDELMTCRTAADGKSGAGATSIVSTALKGIALAMGIAVAVLSILGALETPSAFTMLGVGLSALAIDAFHGEHDK